jgi:hypothetical protein
MDKFTRNDTDRKGGVDLNSQGIERERRGYLIRYCELRRGGRGLVPFM